MALQLIINIDDDAEAVLLNDLVDIESWVQGAVAGKISKCRGRMLAEWQPKLFADPVVTELPANEQAVVDMVRGRGDYMNRNARDAKEIADAAAAEAASQAVKDAAE